MTDKIMMPETELHDRILEQMFKELIDTHFKGVKRAMGADGKMQYNREDVERAFVALNKKPKRRSKTKVKE